MLENHLLLSRQQQELDNEQRLPQLKYRNTGGGGCSLGSLNIREKKD